MLIIKSPAPTAKLTPSQMEINWLAKGWKVKFEACCNARRGNGSFSAKPETGSLTLPKGI